MVPLFRFKCQSKRTQHATSWEDGRHIPRGKLLLGSTDEGIQTATELCALDQAGRVVQLLFASASECVDVQILEERLLKISEKLRQDALRFLEGCPLVDAVVEDVDELRIVSTLKSSAPMKVKRGVRLSHTCGQQNDLLVAGGVGNLLVDDVLHDSTGARQELEVSTSRIS